MKHFNIDIEKKIKFFYQKNIYQFTAVIEKSLESWKVHNRFLLKRLIIQNLKRKIKYEPIEYIINKTFFLGLLIKINYRALIPRSDTEELIYFLLNKYIWNNINYPKSIVDLGTGSGSIALSLSKYTINTKILAIDISINSLNLTYENLRKNFIEIYKCYILKSYWFLQINPLLLKQKFNWIISNPPYLSKQILQQSSNDIKIYEPKKSLLTYCNGLLELKYIILKGFQFLKFNGMLILEIGESHNNFLLKTAKLRLYKYFYFKMDINFNLIFLFLEK